jgi:hypothetical protein
MKGREEKECAGCDSQRRADLNVVTVKDELASGVNEGVRCGADWNGREGRRGETMKVGRAGQEEDDDGKRRKTVVTARHARRSTCREGRMGWGCKF